MSLFLQINEDIKAAQKSKDALVLSTLRMVSAAFKNEIIALKKRDENTLNDQECIGLLAKEAKKRKDSIKAYTQGNRPELAEKETQELAIIEKYLPKQLNEQEIADIIKKIIADNPDIDFGPLMGKIMGQLKGKADGQLVQKILKENIKR